MGYFYENGIIVEQNLEYAQELYEASLKDTNLFLKQSMVSQILNMKNFIAFLIKRLSQV
jgi:hypothetical protein